MFPSLRRLRVTSSQRPLNLWLRRIFYRGVLGAHEGDNSTWRALALRLREVHLFSDWTGPPFGLAPILVCLTLPSLRRLEVRGLRSHCDAMTPDVLEHLGRNISKVEHLELTDVELDMDHFRILLFAVRKTLKTLCLGPTEIRRMAGNPSTVSDALNCLSGTLKELTICSIRGNGTLQTLSGLENLQYIHLRSHTLDDMFRDCKSKLQELRRLRDAARISRNGIFTRPPSIAPLIRDMFPRSLEILTIRNLDIKTEQWESGLFTIAKEMGAFSLTTIRILGLDPKEHHHIPWLPERHQGLGRNRGKCEYRCLKGQEKTYRCRARLHKLLLGIGGHGVTLELVPCSASPDQPWGEDPFGLKDLVQTM